VATKIGIAKTISDQYHVKCKCERYWNSFLDFGDSWSVNGDAVVGSMGAKVLAKRIFKSR